MTRKRNPDRDYSPNWGGADRGQGRKKKKGPLFVRRCLSLPLELDVWIRGQQKFGEGFSHTVTRLLKRSRRRQVEIPGMESGDEGE